MPEVGVSSCMSLAPASPLMSFRPFAAMDFITWQGQNRHKHHGAEEAETQHVTLHIFWSHTRAVIITITNTSTTPTIANDDN